MKATHKLRMIKITSAYKNDMSDEEIAERLEYLHATAKAVDIMPVLDDDTEPCPGEEVNKNVSTKG